MTAFALALGLAFGYTALACGAIFASKRACRGIVSFDDGPRAGKPPEVALLAIAACVGAVLAWHHTSARALVLSAILTASLVACCYSDVLVGIVPDRFTLLPLAAVLADAAIFRDAGPAISCLVVLAPFALAAWVSGGRGMGWGDVKLVALIAAVLGIETSIVAFSAACLVAAGIAFARRRQAEPIAFVPYLAGSAALALALPLPRAL